MRAYLEDNQVYVENENKLIYQVVSIDTFSNTCAMYLNLELLGGYDYVNPDYTEVQGYVSNENFIEDLQTKTEVMYFMQEGMVECLEENGYKILEKLPKIHQVILK